MMTFNYHSACSLCSLRCKYELVLTPVEVLGTFQRITLPNIQYSKKDFNPWNKHWQYGNILSALVYYHQCFFKELRPESLWVFFFKYNKKCTYCKETCRDYRTRLASHLERAPNAYFGGRKFEPPSWTWTWLSGNIEDLYWWPWRDHVMPNMYHTVMPDMYHTVMPDMYHTVLPDMYHTFMPGLYHTVMPDMYHTVMPDMYHTVMPDMYHTVMPDMYHTVMPGMRYWRKLCRDVSQAKPSLPA